MQALIKWVNNTQILGSGEDGGEEGVGVGKGFFPPAGGKKNAARKRNIGN